MRRRCSATGGRRDQSARCRAGSPSGFRQTRYGGDPVVQFPCTSHLPYTPSIVDRSGTDTGLQSDLEGLDYCNSVLYGAPVSSIQKLQRVQNNAARIVLQAPRWSHAKPLMCQLHWLPVQHRIDYKTLKTSVPQYLSQRINRRTDTALVSYATAHPTVRSYQLRETFFSMCRAVCLELTSRVCHQKRLIVCIQI